MFLARIDYVRWSPDSRHIAFTVTQPDRISLYVAEAEQAKARKILDKALNNVYYGTPFG